MRPWKHAVSTSQKRNGQWSEYLAIHEFMDFTKFCSADRRHRLVLHHVDLGAELASRAFPELSNVTDIVEQHVVEDLGVPATLANWVDGFNASKLPMPLQRRLDAGREKIIEMIGRRMPEGSEKFIGEVYDLLCLPSKYYPAHPERALCVLMNSAGRESCALFGVGPENMTLETQK